jgi:hypothetical protein
MTQKELLLFEAKNESQLTSILRHANPIVPTRIKVRTKNQIEQYDMIQLLNTLLKERYVKYPLRLIHRDRPDFLLIMGNQRIGIEHTEAISENEAPKDSLREKGYGCRTFLISPAHPAEPNKKANELIEEIKACMPGDGWDGDSAEIEWATAMLYTGNRKLAIINKTGFERFDEDWLLIWDNWNLPSLDMHKAALFYLRHLHHTIALREFRRIFILRDQVTCEVSTTGIKIHNIKNLPS